MYRRLTLAISLLLLLSLVGSASASLVAQWKLDDGSGTTAKDSIGSINGTLLNGPVWVKGPKGDGALQFDGVDDCVDLGVNPLWNPAGSFSVALWMNIGAWNTEWGHSPIGTQEDNNGWCIRRFGSWWASQNAALWTQPTSAISFTTPGVLNGGVQDLPSNITPPLNQWIHVACVYDSVNHMKYIYINAEPQGSMAVTGTLVAATTKMYLGAIAGAGGAGTNNLFTGMLDDVRLYTNALSATDVKAVFAGTDSSTAVNPNPADKATDLPRETVLSWRPGPFAGTHNVYFGTNFDDVNNALIGSPLLVSKGQDANTWQPPTRLSLGQTYYWRVDEVNAPPTSSTVFKGKTWTFTIEPVAYKVTGVTATASNAASTSPAQNTVNDSGIDPTTDLASMDTASTQWLTVQNPPQPVWIEYDLGTVYKLAEMWVWNSNSQFEWALNFGLKNVTIEYSANGTDWTKLGDYAFAQAPSASSYAHSDTVPFGGVAAKKVRITATSNYGGKSYGLSEVRFFYVPVQARQPQPATGATGISPDVVLSWRAGREAASHKVYLGIDSNTVASATVPVDTVTSNSYDPASISLATTYYWRVDEVNTAEAISTWAGPVWSFTTVDYIAVDDMESYNDVEPTRIFDVWVDGYGTTTNGSVVGYGTSANGTFGETTIVHGGKQSMPFAYTNTATVPSEAKQTFGTAQDWTAAGVKTLTLYFYGDPASAAVQLYVTINSTKVLYNGPADNVQRARWNQWNVDLSTIAASSLKSVKTLTIGVSGAGKGTLFFDDIRLYKTAPAIPVAVNPGTTGLAAYYAFTNNVTDGSGTGNNGTLVGAPTYVAGLPGYGTAMHFNGTADAVNLGANKPAFNPTGSLSISLWANIGAWSTAWGNVMISNRGESGIGWQLRRYSSPLFCFTTRGTGNEDMPTTIAPPLNQWIHIACVFSTDGATNTKTIYVNGIQNNQMTAAVTGTVTARIAASTFNTYIAARDVGTNAVDTTTFFTGMLDEIRVYSRALSAGEVEFLSDPTP